MKRILSALMCMIMLVGLVGCGGRKEGHTPKKEIHTPNKEVYAPKEISKYNSIYRDTTNKGVNGGYPIINISNVEKKDDNIVISIGAPTIEQINYDFNNFLYVRPLDEEGNELKLDKVNLEEICKEDIEATLNITGVEVEKVKWIEVGPYKTKNDNPVVFKIE